jgi:hypothetical protein
MKDLKIGFTIPVFNISLIDGLNSMVEPHSEDELEFIRFLIRKYIPGLKSQGKEMPSVMFDKDYPNEKDKKSSK